ncbi:dockerin type I repeat protein [Ruminiclostridium sufflavum DSM 19573]|uniref:cellulase n=1 Tax=Ruminiclostridium sufflavum DSM 19573 TaxID=1121337 RepID=A0A318XHP9_9FIRM|nr:glycoside hydrolase family 48 protein [Ruminiclostridium sufflavum]PYG86544.1 dockerin type I repeat protein [Ruminiclostridium sufflavum DSM 19573]
MRKGIKRISAMAVAASMTLSVMVPSTVLAVGDEITGPVNQEYADRFNTMYNKIMASDSGYFSPDGVPYHTIETMNVEAPDYGHVTTSEAFSYYMWLEAMNGRLNGDFSGFKKSWDVAEKYIIPSDKDQPETSMSRYDPSKPATYAGEWQDPSKYPSKLDSSAPVGKDPIFNDLKSTYGTSMIYGMHWLLDVDNWYGFGNRGDGTSKNSYINTFQRGEQESTWETIPQPSWDAMKFGGKNGFLDLFTGDSSYATQFKYTNAPDADARAVQATYLAKEAAKSQGVNIDTYVKKASKMGDYLRYSMFDKYFRKVGDSAQAGTGYDACMYLLSWYYAWGGGVSSQWAWVIGSSHNHFGYQNPFAAYVLSTDADMKPKAANSSTDWGKSLDRQIEFYQWLQSAEGAIAGGASNSYNGRYETWPSGTSKFYGMGYVENPVYADPGSNTWFGMQCWSMQRIMQLYYETGDSRLKTLADNWAKWANSEIKFEGGTYSIPNTIDWEGQPDTWNGTYTGNPNLHVSVVNRGTDLGVTSSLINALSYYAAASGDETSRNNAQKLLDTVWANYQDEKGIGAPETRTDYSRFNQEVYVPSGWSGTMPNGDKIQPGIKFIDIRSKYKQDPNWPQVEKYLKSGKAEDAPTITYHRFWAQSEYAVANGVYAMLFPDGGGLNGDANGDGSIDALDLAMVKKFLLGNTVDMNKENADVNDDGSVDALDLAAIKKILLNQ